MALLSTQKVAIPSLLPTFAAASAGGDTITPGNNTFLVVKNGGGSSINVTVAVPGNDSFGNARPDLVVAVANGTERYIPVSSNKIIDPSTGLVSVTYSAVTSVTVGVISV